MSDSKNTKDAELATLRAQLEQMGAALAGANERAQLAEQALQSAAVVVAPPTPNHEPLRALPPLDTRASEIVALLAKIETHTHAATRALVLIERAQTLQLQIASAAMQAQAQQGKGE